MLRSHLLQNCFFIFEINFRWIFPFLSVCLSIWLPSIFDWPGLQWKSSRKSSIMSGLVYLFYCFNCYDLFVQEILFSEFHLKIGKLIRILMFYSTDLSFLLFHFILFSLGVHGQQHHLGLLCICAPRLLWLGWVLSFCSALCRSEETTFSLWKNAVFFQRQICR